MSRMQSTSGDDDDIFYDLEIIYSTDDFLDSESDPAEEDLDDDFELQEWNNEHGEKSESSLMTNL